MKTQDLSLLLFILAIGLVVYSFKWMIAMKKNSEKTNSLLSEILELNKQELNK